MSIATLTGKVTGTAAAVTVSNGADHIFTRIGPVGRRTLFSDKLVSGVQPGHEKSVFLDGRSAKSRSILATVPVAQRVELGSCSLTVPRFDPAGTFLGLDVITVTCESLNSTSVVARQESLCLMMSLLDDPIVQVALLNQVVVS